MEKSARRHVFVIKLWREAERDDTALRISVVHVASGRRIVTTQMRDATDFMLLRGQEPAEENC